MSQPLIEYNNVFVGHDELSVLKDITVSIGEAELVYLIGKVGSGKSTFIKSLYGEASVTAGEANVLGTDLTKLSWKTMPMLRRKLGIVFQDFKLLTDRTVEENLEFVLKATDMRDKDQIKNRIQEVLQYVGLPNKGYKRPHELSGGEQQRIVIARALLNNPKLLLADEPTGNLDPETGREVMTLIKQIVNEGTTVVMATHNMRWLKMHEGRILRFENHQMDEISTFEATTSNASYLF